MQEIIQTGVAIMLELFPLNTNYTLGFALLPYSFLQKAASTVTILADIFCKK
jgi:hypothetical protein